ncbi:DNA ligase 1-like isoform X2 [Daphnia pulicaria]|uniref:DNA ligase 1-like isoform X2 n=1 Tax=Daphnia pulicaria TaxID=35523 RepID=UPI001EEABDEE|nr:DNA ligase 1-like isoform X2 [Daphnia pulicaria]
MPTSTASLSLSRPGSSRNTGSGVGQPQQPASTEPVVPPWRRVSRQENNAMDSTRLRLIIPPPPPPPSAMAPPPPPPPPPPPAPAVQKREVPEHVAVKLEKYKKTPRKRPDWASMMKEIEVGKQLKRVQTNDRSRPILPQAKAKGKFVYESEKPASDNVANQILLEIQKGVRLKKTKCNDRSRPILNGLGVFRRQVSTVEVDPAEPTTPLIEPEADYDDIDKVRDDLQSTKQLLEIELVNRRKIDEENANLQKEIRRLKEELSSGGGGKKSSPSVAPSYGSTRRSSSTNHFAPETSSILKKSTSKMMMNKNNKSAKKDSSDEDEDSDEDFGDLDAVEEEMNALRGQAELARKTAEEFENRYKETANQLVTTQAEMEDLEMKVAVLKKKLRKAQEMNGGGEPEEAELRDFGTQTDPIEPPPPVVESRPSRSHSKRDLRKQMSRQDSRGSNVSSANNNPVDSEEEEEEEEEEDEAAAYLKAQKRELALLASRLRSTKDKEKNVRNERIALHLQLKKFRIDLKDEKKKYVGLKKEVDGMAVMMNEVGEDEKVEFVVEEVEVTDSEEEEEEDEDDEEEEEDDDDDIEDVEEEESDEDTESDEMETRMDKYNDRLRHHDNTLNTLKKGNYLLKSKVDMAQEELRKERSRYSALEIELNNCLAELG